MQQVDIGLLRQLSVTIIESGSMVLFLRNILLVGRNLKLKLKSVISFKRVLIKIIFILIFHFNNNAVLT